MFSRMSNVSGPGAVHAGDRYLVTGGSVSVRFPQKRLNLVNFDPPSLSAGCGGIDMYGGSFSYIDKQELKETMKAIAANAAGYAFKLGVDALCNQCGKTMDEMQAIIQEMNQGLKNSCEMAQYAVDSTAYGKWANDRIAENQKANGQKKDDNESQNQGPGQQSPAGEAAESGSEALRRFITNNVIWRALVEKKGLGKDSSLDVDETFLQDIMSVTGTVVSCSSKQQGCHVPEEEDAREGDVITTVIEPTLTLRDLVEGGDVLVLRCGDTGTGVDECLNPTPKTVTLESLPDRIIKAFVGETERSPDSIIGKMFRTDAEWTAEQKELMAGCGDICMNTVAWAALERSAAERHIQQNAPLIAAHIAGELIKYRISLLRPALVKIPDSPSKTTAAEMVNRVRTELQNDMVAMGATQRDMMRLSVQTQLLIQNPANQAQTPFMTGGSGY